MSSWAIIYLEGEELCVVHYNGNISHLGGLFLFMKENNTKYTWKDIITICSPCTIMYINIKYLRLNYEFCYNSVKFGTPDLDWPKIPSPEFLKEGNLEEVNESGIVIPETHDDGWGGNRDYIYYFEDNNLFVYITLQQDVDYGRKILVNHQYVYKRSLGEKISFYFS